MIVVAVCGSLLNSNAAGVHGKTAAPNGNPASAPIVNAWTEWGTLRDVVVGDANAACFPPKSGAFMPTINAEGGQSRIQPNGMIVESVGEGVALRKELGEEGWMCGEKPAAVIAAANWQLDNLARVLTERGIKVRRPSDLDDPIDWSGPIKTPFFESANQYCATCPRDVVATVGNIVLEASMSRRDRHFEVHQYRRLIRDLWREDPAMLWKAAPRPSLGDASFDASWWDLSVEQRYAQMHEYTFCSTEEEPLFDGAPAARSPRPAPLLARPPVHAHPQMHTHPLARVSRVRSG